MNKELYTNALYALEEANVQMRYCIDAMLEELGGIFNLEHLPLVYTTNDGEIHTIYADGIFSVGYGEEKVTTIGCTWYDEDGNIDSGNEIIFDLSNNELYSIMDKLHTELVKRKKAD